MPTRVLLEGPAIEPLLAQVRDEYGSGVRIISADKVRTGGIGGFFAKQRYELSVEIPDEPEPPAAEASPLQRARQLAAARDAARAEEPAPTLESLLERAESRDRITGGSESQPRRDSSGPAAAVEGRTAGMDDTYAAAGSRPPRGGLLDTPGNGFAELLAGLNTANAAAEVAGAARDEAADGDGPPTVRPFRPATATGSPVNNAATRPRSAAAAPAPPAAPVNPLEPVIASLRGVGMPESLLGGISMPDTYAAVLTALSSRPAAPAVPAAPGEILVLAGELSRALPIARRLLEQLGVDQTHLLLAGQSAAGTGVHASRVITGSEEAERRAEKLHKAETPWVVVMDAPVGATDATWVEQTCGAIGATAVWAVVDATRKTDDTARHLAQLGEIEALVVHGVEDTTSPASVLGLDLPIVSLDGAPATPHAWAAMLCARVVADVAPPPPVTRRPHRGK